jgi:hypothetical protein
VFWTAEVYEIPNSKHQINKQISNFHPVECCLWQVRYKRNSTGQVSNEQNKFGILNFGHCDLFDICDL